MSDFDEDNKSAPSDSDSDDNDNDNEQEDTARGASSPEPSTPKIEGRQVIVILDMAQLETVKTRKGDYQLLNCDDHISIMRKHNKDPQMFRPDIVHQELMAVLDSPLNKAGLVKVLDH